MLGSMALFNMFGSIFQASEARSDNGSAYYTPKDSLSKRVQRGKLNKSDIGSPSNFKHVTHVGFNAVPGFDAALEMDLKRLFNMAGVKEEHLKDQDVSRSIFSVLQKAGGMEAVRKQSRRMTSAEKPNIRTRLRSLSSSSIAPSKRQNCLELDSPHAAKTLAHGTQSCYLPSLSKVSPPMETPSSFNQFSSIRQLPPYLEEFSQSFTPTANHPVPHLKKRSFPPQPLSASNALKTTSPLHPDAKDIPSGTGSVLLLPSVPDHTCHAATITMASSPPSLPYFDHSSDSTSCILASLPSSIPCIEPPIEIGDVPPTPVANLQSETFMASNATECLVNLDPVFAAIPPPAPPLPLTLMKPCLENPLSNGAEVSFTSQARKTTNPASKTEEMTASNKDPERQTNPVMFLDQIKQGIQLKSVNQTVKVENTDCSNIVTALMDVLKRRHKAIHSSDEDEVEEDDWED